MPFIISRIHAFHEAIRLWLRSKNHVTTVCCRRGNGSHSLVVTVEEPAELFIMQTYISGTKALFLIITLVCSDFWRNWRRWNRNRLKPHRFIIGSMVLLQRMLCAAVLFWNSQTFLSNYSVPWLFCTNLTMIFVNDENREYLGLQILHC